MKIEIEIPDCQDTSVQCISAISQIMDIFRTGRNNDEEIIKRALSPMGNDIQAVISWFLARYPNKTPKFEIKG